MKVFLSWSGDKSKEVAELFNWWIKCVLQSSEPWISTHDIESGTQWNNEISGELASSSLGIICLTKENQKRPWILFEAGALAKGLSENKVCPFLIDLEPKDIEGPLSQFHHSLPKKEGVFKLIKTINSSLGKRELPLDVLNKVFNTYWNQFEKEFKDINRKFKAEKKEIQEKVEEDEKDILKEILYSLNSMDRRMRNVERKENRIFTESKISFNKEFYDSEIRKLISSYLAEKTPNKYIIENVSKKFEISPIQVQNMIREIKSLPF